jgi:hypothetical protein
VVALRIMAGGRGRFLSQCNGAVAMTRTQSCAGPLAGIRNSGGNV